MNFRIWMHSTFVEVVIGEKLTRECYTEEGEDDITNDLCMANVI